MTINATPSPIGHVIENFRIISQIGSGGMGSIYEAEELITQRHIAVKLMTQAGAQSPQHVAQFERERSAITQMQHPGIPTCAGWGTWHGVPWMAMELIRGSSLDSVLKPPINATTAIRYTRETIHILDYCYRTTGMVHRDIKPGNIMEIPASGDTPSRIRLIDYGLALFQDLPDDDNFNEAYAYNGVHTPKDIAGTPAFMPPEQWSGEDMDCRSDMYAIGCMLFGMVTGRMPYICQNAMAYRQAHMQDPIPDPSKYASVSPVLAQTIMRCLAKQRIQRFRTYEALQGALQASLTVETRYSRHKATSTYRNMSPPPAPGTSGWKRPVHHQPPTPSTLPLQPLGDAPTVIMGEATVALDAMKTYDAEAFRTLVTNQ